MMIAEQQRKKSSQDDETFPFALVVSSQQITNTIDDLHVTQALKFPDPCHPDEHDPKSRASQERRYQAERRRRRLAMPDHTEHACHSHTYDRHPLRPPTISLSSTPRQCARLVHTQPGTPRMSSTRLSPLSTPRTTTPRASSSSPYTRHAPVGSNPGAQSLPVTPRAPYHEPTKPEGRFAESAPHRDMQLGRVSFET